MGERIEVVNVWTHPAYELGVTTKAELNALRYTAEPEPGSLTAARLRLADAAEAKEKAYRARMARVTSGEDCSVDRAYHEAVAVENLAEVHIDDAYDVVAALRTKRAGG